MHAATLYVLVKKVIPRETTRSLFFFFLLRYTQFLYSRSEWLVGSGCFLNPRPAGRPSESAIGNMQFRTVRFWQPRPLFLFFGKHFNHPHPLNFDWMFLQLGHVASAFLGCSLAFVPTRGRVFIFMSVTERGEDRKGKTLNPLFLRRQMYEKSRAYVQAPWACPSLNTLPVKIQTLCV